MPEDYFILPEALSYKQECSLTEKFGTSEEEYARQELICHNLRLFVYYANLFGRRKEVMEELFQEGAIGLIMAVRSYDPGTNQKLIFYASRCIVNQMLMYLRKRRQLPVCCCLRTEELAQKCKLISEENTMPDPEQEYLDKEERRELKKAICTLSGHEILLIRLRYGVESGRAKPYTQYETASLLHMTQSGISRQEKKILKKLKRHMSKLH